MVCRAGQRVCDCVCVSVCVCVCVCVCARVCLWVCMWLCTCPCVSSSMCICVWLLWDVYAYVQKIYRCGKETSLLSKTFCHLYYCLFSVSVRKHVKHIPLPDVWPTGVITLSQHSFLLYFKNWMPASKNWMLASKNWMPASKNWMPETSGQLYGGVHTNILRASD